ncbi:MAG: hypothetical protein JXL20_06395 [Deltaproteobacteria bacterium]|nr:hypothetical protein [Deltaproteobacteria bacterium]
MFQPFPQWQQPDRALDILPSESLCPVKAVIEQQKFIAVQLLGEKIGSCPPF